MLRFLQGIQAERRGRYGITGRQVVEGAGVRPIRFILCNGLHERGTLTTSNQGDQRT